MAAFDREALSPLAIFPLPNAVLLPGALLPLQIFEPRYRDMTRDVLAGTGVLAIALLQPGYEDDYYGRPPVHPIAGVGQIIASEELSDGRYHLLLRGVCRVHIDEELPPTHSYRLVRASLLEDHERAANGQLRAAHEQLIALCDRLSMAIDSGGAELRELVRSEKTAGACADLVASALMTDTEQRQRFLEAVDPTERLRRAADHVGRLLVELGPRTGMPN